MNTELINELKATQHHSELIHNGLDGVELPQLQTLNLGRIDQYTDELYSSFIRLIKDTDDEEAHCNIVEMLTNLGRREKLIIARTYRKVFMGELHHIRIKNPLMYSCNKLSDELFSRLIDMLDTNYDKLGEMTDLINNASPQDRNIITTGLMSVVHRGELR